MALSVLDGNQSATTLSSVVTGGEHIVAHSVVSLGSNAISNITTAVSGSIVTIPNLNVLARSVATDGITDGTLNFVKIGGHQDGSNQTAHIVHVSAGGAMKVDASDSTVTFGAIRGTVTIGNTVAITGTVTANPTGTQTIAGTVTANVVGFNPTPNETFGTGVIQSITDSEKDTIRSSLWIADSSASNGSATEGQILSQNYPMPIYGTVTIGSAVFSKSTGSVSMPTQAVLLGFGYDSNQNFVGVNDQAPLPVQIYSAIPAGTNRIGVVTIGGGSVTLGASTAQIGSVTASISGTVPVSGTFYQATQPVSLTTLPALVAGTAKIGSVTASISNSVVTFYPLQGTAVSNTNFTSVTASTTLVSAVANREVLTVFNEGAGNLHISPGATCTTVAYQVRLSAGDYWECPQGQLSLAHTAVFATAGTARVTEVS